MVSVRSYSKINVGLAIGAPRPDGFHGLTTLYQTLALHDVLTVVARRAPVTRIALRSNDPRVPLDGRNTAWKMVERALAHAGVRAEVTVQIQKNLPIQGGMGAGSANAAAALTGLERELDLRIGEQERAVLAASVGSDVPLFLVGGAVLGTNRGEKVEPMPALTLDGMDEIPCVVALPRVGVSTPQAFRDWDARFSLGRGDSHAGVVESGLRDEPIHDRLEELSRIYASVFSHQSPKREANDKSGASGIFSEPSSGTSAESTPESKFQADPSQTGRNSPENLQAHSIREQLHASLDSINGEPVDGAEGRSGLEDDLAENTLLALVHTGIGSGILNDFETVVFPQTPSLREIKRHLMGEPGSAEQAIYAALSGSGSALFGLYRSGAHAEAAQQRLQLHGVRAIVTKTLPRSRYWSDMFAE